MIWVPDQQITNPIEPYGYPPPPGYGGGDGGPNNPGVIKIRKITSDNTMLSLEQLERLEDELQEKMDERCYVSAAYNQLVSNGIKFTFKVNPSQSEYAKFNPITNEISFKGTQYFDQIDHELFHGYQDYTYNGLENYVNYKANIEFERWLMEDISNAVNGYPIQLAIPEEAEEHNLYFDWITEFLTSNSTVYPTFIPPGDYRLFLGAFAEHRPEFGTNTTRLHPNAAQNLFGSSDCQ